MYNFEDKIFINGAGSNAISHYIYIYNKNYIPFSMLFNVYSNRTSYKTTKELLEFYKDNFKKVDSLKSIEKEIKAWIEDVPICFHLQYNGNRNLVSKLYDIVINRLYFSRTNFRSSSNYISGYYSLFDMKLTTGYFVLVIKKEYTKYVKLSILLNEPILDDCFEFWYDENLVNSSFRIKRLTTKIIKELSAIDVPCINKSHIMDLLQPTIEFKAPTINKQKELVNEFVEEFQKYENEVLNPIPKKVVKQPF